MMVQIYPILFLVGIGLLAGIVLAVASTIMAVPIDETAAALEEVLPGANCGGCGYSGCAGYAAAMADGSAQLGLCSPGGSAVASLTAEILGQEAGEVMRKTALVHCMGNDENTTDKMNYDGLQSCAAAMLLAGGVSSCKYGCMGLGDCQAACEYGAVHIVDGLAMIDPNSCTGCSKCIRACPKQIIGFVDLKSQAVVRCSSCDKAKETMAACKVGCIACKKCERTCKFDAIHVKDFCASVDSEKCVACGECVDVCPRKIIDIFGVRHEIENVPATAATK